jgi:hypothetical protein
MSFLQTTYKILSKVFLSSLIVHAGEVNEDHQYGFRSNRSATDNIYRIL